MSDYTRIFIRDLNLMMRIGVSEGERAAPQRVVVNVSADVTAPADWQADDYAQVVCYATLATAIRAMAQVPVALAETFAEKIAAEALNTAGVLAVTVRVEKPAILTDATVGVEIRRAIS